MHNNTYVKNGFELATAGGKIIPRQFHTPG
jgi:hypothetical protein